MKAPLSAYMRGGLFHLDDRGGDKPAHTGGADDGASYRVRSVALQDIKRIMSFRIFEIWPSLWHNRAGNLTCI